jgi:hypothetical protein
MKVLVTADIHANIEAFEAVLKKEKGGFEGFLFLGDITGYGPDPEACIRLLRKLQATVSPCYILSGNHDAALSGKIPLSWFNTLARGSVEKTKQDLSPGSALWLAALPEFLVLPGPAFASHASPLKPLTEYIRGGPETADALSFLADKKIRIGFTGHTHEAVVYSANPDAFSLHPVPGQIFRLDEFPAIINPGSIGFPRSFNGGRTEDMEGTAEAISEKCFPAYYAVWDTELFEVCFRDARYDRRPVELRIARLKQER